MNRNTLSVGAVGLLVLCSSGCIPIETTHRQVAAPAEPVPAASTGFKQPAEFHPDDLLCRTYEITGTRIGKQRICKTREQWVEHARAAQEAMSDIQNGNTSQPGGETLGPVNPY